MVLRTGESRGVLTEEMGVELTPLGVATMVSLTLVPGKTRSINPFHAIVGKSIANHR